MTRKYIEQGSEYLLGFAKKKLAQLQEQVRDHHIPYASKILYIDGSEIFVAATDGDDSEIRITGTPLWYSLSLDESDELDFDKLNILTRSDAVQKQIGRIETKDILHPEYAFHYPIPALEVKSGVWVVQIHDHSHDVSGKIYGTYFLEVYKDNKRLGRMDSASGGNNFFTTYGISSSATRIMSLRFLQGLYHKSQNYFSVYDMTIPGVNAPDDASFSFTQRGMTYDQTIAASKAVSDLTMPVSGNQFPTFDFGYGALLGVVNAEIIDSECRYLMYAMGARHSFNGKPEDNLENKDPFRYFCYILDSNDNSVRCLRTVDLYGQASVYAAYVETMEKPLGSGPFPYFTDSMSWQVYVHSSGSTWIVETVHKIDAEMILQVGFAIYTGDPYYYTTHRMTGHTVKYLVFKDGVQIDSIGPINVSVLTGNWDRRQDWFVFYDHQTIAFPTFPGHVVSEDGNSVVIGFSTSSSFDSYGSGEYHFRHYMNGQIFILPSPIPASRNVLGVFYAISGDGRAVVGFANPVTRDDENEFAESIFGGEVKSTTAYIEGVKVKDEDVPKVPAKGLFHGGSPYRRSFTLSVGTTANTILGGNSTTYHYVQVVMDKGELGIKVKSGTAISKNSFGKRYRRYLLDDRITTNISPAL